MFEGRVRQWFSVGSAFIMLTYGFATVGAEKIIHKK